MRRTGLGLVALFVVAGVIAVPTVGGGAVPARASTASWFEAVDLGWLPEFLRVQTGLDLDWASILHGGGGGGGGAPTPNPSSEPTAAPSPSSVPVTEPTTAPTPPTPTTPTTPTASSPPSESAAPVPSLTSAPTSEPQPSPVPTPVPTLTVTPPPTVPPTVPPSVGPTSAPDPTAAPTATQSPTSAPNTRVPAKPLLIKHGWDIPSPTFVRSNVSSMEQLPFDGLTIAMPGLSSQVQRQAPVSYEQFRAALAPVAATHFTTLTHNFVMVYATPGGDYFGDWSVPVANFANLARAAREAGFEGVAYDNEEYFGRSVDYPAGCPDHPLVECQDQVRLRGQQVMDAMRAQWPTVRTLTTFGAWVSEPQTYKQLSPVLAYNDISWANELEGSFVVGMTASTVGTTAKVIDGGEIYTARTPTQFAAVHRWQKDGMAANSGLIPAALRGLWTDTLSAGFGVYDQPWIGAPMDVDVWRSTLATALATTDEYVWAYTERFDWWGTGSPSTRVPADWVAATREARLAAG